MASQDSGGSAVVVQSMKDVRRAREFYRYLRPSNLVHPAQRRKGSTFDLSHDHVPSISSALTPYCQLTALRCNAKKAMLNCMDRDVMYFLAEACRQKRCSDLEEVYDFVEDPILMSCSAVPLKGRVCELTIQMDPKDAYEKPPMFVIPDLSKSQFSDLSVVEGPPFYRFYAGTPITTRDGVNIGSLAIMDDKPRQGLTSDEEEFLGKTAAQIMTYLETNRQAIEGRRSRRMAKGLESFIAGKKVLDEGLHGPHTKRRLNRHKLSTYGLTIVSDDESADMNGISTQMRSTQPDRGHIPTASFELHESPSSTTTSDDIQRQDGLDGNSRTHSKTFARAANLLRECFDLDEDGSVTFFAVGSKLSGRGKHAPSHARASHQEVRDSDLNETPPLSPITNRNSTRPAVIIARSTEVVPFVGDDELEADNVVLDDELLSDLIARYPNGRLWNFDEVRSSSSEEDFQKSSHSQRFQAERKQRNRRRKGYETQAIGTAFPGARQVLFAPLFDTTTATFAHGVFIASTQETRSFDPTADLSFLHAFCSTVMAENSRIDIMIADKQKSDFVGTISHEMRSPLHGVLASVEFLAETDVTSFQKSLIDTIDSCGKTLLDTINHVLDYSKVNSFQKHWEASNKKQTNRRGQFLGPENPSKAISSGAPPLLQLFAVTDISAILEEVLDGLVLGRAYNSGLDITDVSRDARGVQKHEKKASSNSVPIAEPVSIVLDVDYADYIFVTQPGAVRRIIMNIIGNAIKYTSRGTVTIQLQLKHRPEESDSTYMLFTVTDTGKGISQSFLESKLFVPFAQENALAPGTGLGLSIVQSIVTMLGGSIEVKSKLGKGTTFQVALPLTRPLPGQHPSENTPSSGDTAASANSLVDESIVLLRTQASRTSVAFYSPKNATNINDMAPVARYIEKWYDLTVTEALESASVVITDESGLEDLIQLLAGTPGHRPALVIMCSVISRHSAPFIKSFERQVGGAVEFVAKPFGPHKLARSIRLALEKKQVLRPDFPHVGSLSSIAEVSPTDVSTTIDKVNSNLQMMDLNKAGEESPAKFVQGTEDFAASQSSQRAQMAINNPAHDFPLRTPRSAAPISEGDAFPFPEQDQEQSRRRRESYRGTPQHVKDGEAPAASNAPTAKVTNQIVSVNNVITHANQKVDPYILLVDDNNINLKLLESFLRRKRYYTRILQAEDGKQAVDLATAPEQHFDIIFMDISMPIMNGFEATRAIREHEDRGNVKPGAMIIALTGLASGRDQSEGFESGCDIYMTKPVSFKEVSKLLDNWEGHQKLGVASESDVEAQRANLGNVVATEKGLQDVS